MLSVSRVCTSREPRARSSSSSRWTVPPCGLSRRRRHGNWRIIGYPTAAGLLTPRLVVLSHVSMFITCAGKVHGAVPVFARSSNTVRFSRFTLLPLVFFASHFPAASTVPEPRPSFITLGVALTQGVRPSSLRVESLPSCFLAYLARSRCF